ncbi:phosphodiesterase [Calderihabitans maritimus]|uniref:Phosphoesterase n=1 Tax=Calderihabitans maritimus TaxID=1246530 RepID=A0A1Z5HPF4_9FIRM|nr:phosphodiesterase [Calderihabitans maritimus]GAW91412.1 phosphodiesterase YfcE [Calderihabitans maritimus]
MKIGVVSDTHGDASTWEKVMNNIFRDVELIVHAGDVLYHGPRNPIVPGYNPARLAEMLNQLPIPLLIARGNCDADVDQLVLEYPLQSSYVFFQHEGRRFLVHHGHGINGEQAQEMAQRFRVDMYISGHTHVPFLDVKEDTVFLNPGSCSLPKDEDKRKTVALVEDRGVTIIDVYREEVFKELSF